MENIAETQSQVEALALLMGSYYDGLVRANVPPELASELTCAYQDWVLQQAAAAQARAQQQAQTTQVLGTLFGKK